MWKEHVCRDGLRTLYADIGGLGFAVEQVRAGFARDKQLYLWRLWVLLPDGTELCTYACRHSAAEWRQRAEEIGAQYAASVLFDFTKQPERWSRKHSATDEAAS